MPRPTVHSASQVRKLTLCAAHSVVFLLTTFITSAPAAEDNQPALAQPTEEAIASESRFILPENREQYVAKMLAKLSMTNRRADPFGRPQDPDAKPEIIVADPTKTRITTLQQKTSLQDMVAPLRVRMIIPSEKRFLLGDRSFQVGDTIPFTYRTKAIKAKVVAVNAAQIDLRDATSGETASLKIKMLPPGMQPGGMMPATPGLYRTENEASIDLESPSFR